MDTIGSMFGSLETEADSSSSQDGGSWIGSLLQDAVGAYTTVVQAKTTSDIQKLNAGTKAAGAASNTPLVGTTAGINNNTLLLVGGGLALVLVAVLVLRK